MAIKKKGSSTVYKDECGNRFLWGKTVYKEWFEYCQLIKNLPKQFKSKDFDTWYDSDVFAEPSYEDLIKVVKTKGSKITVEIDVIAQSKPILERIAKILANYRPSMRNNPKLRLREASHAKVQPSKVMQDIKLESLKEDRKIYALKQEALNNLEVAYKADLLKTKYNTKTQRDKPISSKKVYDFKISLLEKTKKKSEYEDGFTNACEKTIDNATRTIQRAVQRVEAILKNIAKGNFP